MDDSSDQQKKRKVYFQSRSLRLSIIDQLTTFDINISLLMDVIKNYRFDMEFEDLVEIMRALDILGAETRSKENQIALYYLELRMSTNNVKEWENQYGDRLPVWKILISVNHLRK